jgi:hypothetical protein
MRSFSKSITYESYPWLNVTTWPNSATALRPLPDNDELQSFAVKRARIPQDPFQSCAGWKHNSNSRKL